MRRQICQVLGGRGENGTGLFESHDVNIVFRYAQFRSSHTSVYFVSRRGWWSRVDDKIDFHYGMTMLSYIILLMYARNYKLLRKQVGEIRKYYL